MCKSGSKMWLNSTKTSSLFEIFTRWAEPVQYVIKYTCVVKLKIVAQESNAVNVFLMDLALYCLNVKPVWYLYQRLAIYVSLLLHNINILNRTNYCVLSFLFYWRHALCLFRVRSYQLGISDSSVIICHHFKVTQKRIIALFINIYLETGLQISNVHKKILKKKTKKCSIF